MTSDAWPHVQRHFADLKPAIENQFAAQWAYPELPGMEFRSSARLKDFLAQHGFAIEDAPAEIPTAFVARASHGAGPVVAILAEYDALPGLAAEASASFSPLQQASGHACGHNHIGPANSAAAILAAKAMGDLGLAGEVRVIGCPAEEILWGKLALLRGGIFDGVDVILTSHGDYQTGALSRPCQSVSMGEFVFLGRAGHGGGKTVANALTGAEAFISAVEQQARTTFAEVQFRHVLRRAGVTPGITPDEVRVWYSTRNANFARVQHAYAAVAATAEAMAKQHHLKMREQFIAETHGYLPNDVLGQLLFDCMQQSGPPKWTESDMDFMRALSSSCAPDEPMTLDLSARYFNTGEDYYGQDDGEVSWHIPLGRINWAYPEQVTIHHWSWTALSGHPASQAGPLMASQVLALGALRLLQSPNLVEQAKVELRNRTGGKALPMPRLGAERTMRQNPQSFWNATWTEVV